MNDHTPVPWEQDGCSIYDTRGNLIAIRYSGRHKEKAEGHGDIPPVEADANVHFIVRACNSYDKMLETLKAVVLWRESAEAPEVLFEGGAKMMEKVRDAIIDAEKK